MTPSAPDVERILADARALAFPRYPGTAGDARAITLVASRLAETGLELERQVFSYDVRPAFRALRALLLGLAALVGGAAYLTTTSPLTAAAALGLAWVAGGTFLAWSPWLEHIYAADGPTITENVAARRAVDGPRLTLVFVAHHDSKSQNLSMPVRAILTLLAVGGSLGLTILVLAEVLSGPREIAGPALAFGSVAALSLAVLAGLRSGNRSPGGVDNAGSVGILLELARRLPVTIPPDVELVFLSPGAEEDHMVGAMRWLDVHAAGLRRRPVWAINLDGAGIPGRVVLLERFGFGRAFAPHLSRVAREAAAELGTRVRGVLLPPAMGVDAIPFVHRGIPCLTLASGSLGRASLSVHSVADVADHLSGRALGEVAALAERMALRLSRPGRARPAGPV